MAVTVHIVSLFVTVEFRYLEPSRKNEKGFEQASAEKTSGEEGERGRTNREPGTG